MKNKVLLSAATILILIAGCIICDEITTITIRPDGSADWVKFRSNVRSSETGDKRAQELRTFIEEFEAHTGSEFVRIAEAGGEVLEARWVESAEPYSTLIKARFPTAASLERFWTIRGEKGAVLAQARFTRASNRRRLSLIIPGSQEENSETREPITVRELREQQANGFSVTRIAVANGQIVASQGFLVAGDKRSCLMDPTQIDELLRSTTDEVELFVEWEVSE